MQTVTINKGRLLTIVIENRDKHLADYAEAERGYQSEIVKVLSRYLEQVQSKKIPKDFNAIFEIPRPENHVKDYNTIIGMLELSVDQEISLSQQDFKLYVQDEWSWKRAFETVTSNYKGR